MKAVFRFARVPPSRLAVLLTILLAAVSTHASGTWIKPGGGSWAVAGNWANGVIANGSGNAADFSTLALNLTPTVTLDGNRTIGNLVFGDVSNGHGWNLNAGSGGTLTLAGTAPTITVNNQSATINLSLAGTSGMTKGGGGLLRLGGVNSVSGVTTINAGTLALGPTTLAGDTTSGSAQVFTLNIASGAIVQMSGTLALNGSSANPVIQITGTGILQLTSTNSSAASPDISFGDNDIPNSNANWGSCIAANVDLGSVQRYVWAKTGHNGVGRYGLTDADGQFGGSVSGSGGITYIAQDNYTASTPMETPLCLNASNSFSGPFEIRRGSVYLGNANALTRTNLLFLNPSGTDNVRFFLYGNNTAVANLSSSTNGSVVIANGNEKSGSSVTLGAATLSVWQNIAGTFSGSIQDVFAEYDGSGSGTTGPLSLAKNGAATLTLAGPGSFTGSLTVNAGKLYMNSALAGPSVVTVAGGATLGGSGTINAPVTVANTGSVEAGFGQALGTLSMNSLTLGSGAGGATTLNIDANVGGLGSLTVINPGGLAVNGNVAVNVIGTLPGVVPVTYPLISYSGAAQINGKFVLGSVPDSAVAYITNNTSVSAIQLVVSGVTIPSVTWVGAPNNVWDLAGGNVWTQTGTAVSASYADGDQVELNDAAANFTVNLAAVVAPNGVVISNSAHNYTISGVGGITGLTGLVKAGGAVLTLGTSNSYAGGTIISAGTLALGGEHAIPGGVQVDGTLDLGGFDATVGNLAGSGIVDNSAPGASPVLTINTAGSVAFAGAIQNTGSPLGLSVTGGGTVTLNGHNTYLGPTQVNGARLVVNGSLAGGATVQNGTLGGSGIVAGPVGLAPGAALNLGANAPLTTGPITLNGPVTVNVSGSVSTTNAGTYQLLNHGPLGGPGAFVLGPIPGIIGGPFTATLIDTNNQLSLVVQSFRITGTLADVRHVVIFMQENRSFDHYFGTLHGVRGFGDRTALTLQNGNSDYYQPNGSSYVLPFHTSQQCLSDLGHGWSDTHQAWDGGEWDQWVPAKSSETMAYLERGDLPYYYALADAYTICDDYHCSTFCSTDPNRLYFMSGMIDPNGTGGGPVIDNSEPNPGWRWTTYPERLQNAGVSWKIYQSADNFDDNALAWFAVYQQARPGNPLYDLGVKTVNDLVGGFAADVTNNTLPTVSWIIAAANDSEHPSASPANGEALTKQLLDVIASNPAIYNSTVFILNYDENDGFFDHAVPITPPAGTPDEFVGGLPTGLGVRVPAMIVSPWTRGGYVCSQVFDHTSTLRFLERVTGVVEPNISAWRRQVCGDLTSAFDFAHPNTNYPSLTGVAPVDCGGGSTATPPAQQSVPVQEAGTLLERPLPYQPNTISAADCGTGNFNLTMTNSGPASVHFAIYPNAFRTDGPWAYDAPPGAAANASFSATASGGNYDFTCYGPNGFLRRFAGNVAADCSRIEVASFINSQIGGFALVLSNLGAATVSFGVTNSYVTNGLATYNVAAGGATVVPVPARTNNGWYDVTVTTGAEAAFVRRFAGHVETNAASPALISSENPAGYKDNVILTATIAGFGTPSGSIGFKNGNTFLGAPLTLSNGVAALASGSLPRGTNLITAEYSGDRLNPAVTNVLVQVITNHPPVVASAGYIRLAGLPLTIGIGDLLTHATDADGDALSLASIDTVSARGVTITTNLTYLVYGNTTSVSPDTFGYTVTDGFGGAASGVVSVSMAAGGDGEVIKSLSTADGTATVTFAVVPNYTFWLQRATNLTLPVVWVNIRTNASTTNGLFQASDNFSDLPKIPPAAYYRLKIQ